MDLLAVCLATFMLLLDTVLREPEGISAGALVFIGVVELQRFEYREIRDFAHRALSTVARNVPEARHIALTLHGAGYGLDEIEAFDSELAGIFDAIHAGDVPRGLDRVTIVEMVPDRAARMADRLERFLRGGKTVSPGSSAGDVMEAASANRIQRVGYDSAGREHAFVAMPFAQEFEDVFHYGISSAVREVGLICERVDQQAFTGEIIERVKRQIQTARLIVADLSGANPNVYLEVGYAWGREKPTVLLCRSDCQLTFDVQGQKCLRYSTIMDAEKLLTKELLALLAR